MPNIGWVGGGPDGPRKKNCDLSQIGAIFRQEGSGSMLVDSTVVQNVLSLFRSIFSNGIHTYPHLQSSAESLRYYDEKVTVKKDSRESEITNHVVNQIRTRASLR